AKCGMDKPLGVQYVNYLADVARGDFGPSLQYTDRSALQSRRAHYKGSLTLGGCATLIASVTGVRLGVLAALRRRRIADCGGRTLASLGVCVPTFVTAPLLVLAFASKLGWLPNGGWNGGALPNLVLPITVLALPQIAII